MVPNELLEELRGTWGPSPKDPERGIMWEESMELLAQVPQLLAKTIRRDGTNFDSELHQWLTLSEKRYWQLFDKLRFLHHNSLWII